MSIERTKMLELWRFGRMWTTNGRRRRGLSVAVDVASPERNLKLIKNGRFCSGHCLEFAVKGGKSAAKLAQFERL